MAKDETLVITFTNGGSYKIDDLKPKAYAKGETVEVKVESDVEIVTYELPTDFQANIDEAFKKVNFNVDSEKNGVELIFDEETNTLRVEITDFSDLGTTTQKYWHHAVPQRSDQEGLYGEPEVWHKQH